VKLETQKTVIQSSSCSPLVVKFDIKFRLTGKTERIDQPLLRVAAALDHICQASYSGAKFTWFMVGQDLWNSSNNYIAMFGPRGVQYMLSMMRKCIMVEVGGDSIQTKNWGDL